MSEEHKPFWMVYRPGGRAPAVQHLTEEEARKEVERLVARESRPVYLLKAVACCVPLPPPPVEWAELPEAPGSSEIHRKDRVGILNVETDWDFGMVISGQSYTDVEFSVIIYHLDELREAKLLGPFGAPEGGKTWEIEEALRRILAHPEEPFSNLGGNRGASWTPAEL